MNIESLKELTAVILKDAGREQAEADIAAIKTGQTQVYRHAVSEVYFSTLRLAVAREPELAKRISVTYIDGDAKPHLIGLRFADQRDWPRGFLEECWSIESEIHKIRRTGMKDSPRLGFAAEVETSRSNGGERTAESLAGQVVESKSDKGSGDSEIAPYPGVIETAAGVSLSIPRYNELTEAEQKFGGYDVCDCGHYRSAHQGELCDGWMPKHHGYGSSCSCKKFAQAGAEPATTSATASENTHKDSQDVATQLPKEK